MLRRGVRFKKIRTFVRHVLERARYTLKRKCLKAITRRAEGGRDSNSPVLKSDPCGRGARSKGVNDN